MLSSVAKKSIATADGEVVVQRPAKILLKVQVPVIKTDVAQMTSDGQTFRVAILNGGGSGKCKKFVKGTNNADYSKLQKTLKQIDIGDGSVEKRQRIRQSPAAALHRRPARQAHRSRQTYT